MTKTLVVCGCSSSAASDSYPGTSYAELLAKKLDYKLIHLARQGISNGGIRLQIDECIRLKPDFAIIAPTFHDRIEVPVGSYEPVRGLQNINYIKDHYSLLSESLRTLSENRLNADRSKPLSPTKYNAVKHYISNLYDSNWKQQLDTWIMRDGIVQAFLEGIKFIVLPDNLWSVNTVRTIIPDIVPDKFLITEDKFTPSHARYLHPVKYNNWDPGYHSDPKGQEYLAEIYYDIIADWNNR